MNTKRAIKVVKNGKRKVPKNLGKIESAAGSNRWSMSVKSWVSEFQKRRRDGSIPAFNSLFK